MFIRMNKTYIGKLACTLRCNNSLKMASRCETCRSLCTLCMLYQGVHMVDDTLNMTKCTLCMLYQGEHMVDDTLNTV